MIKVDLTGAEQFFTKAGPDAFKIPPTRVFAQGISEMLGSVGLTSPAAQQTAFGLMILSVSAFCASRRVTAGK